MSDKSIGAIALAISILAGSTFSAFAKGLSEVLSPLSLIFVSELLILLLLLVSFGLFPIVQAINNLKRSQKLTLVLVGLLTGVAGPFLWFTGISQTTAVNAGFFSRTEMIFVLILAHFLLRESITKAHYSAIISILTGVLIISFRGFTNGIDMHVGDGFVVLGVACYGLAHVLFRLHLPHIHSHLPLFMRSICAMTVFFMTSPFLDISFIDQVRMLPQYLTPALIGFVLISRLLNSVTFYEAADRLEMSTVSLVSSLTIIGTVTFAWLYLGENIYWYHFAGGAFILLGNLLLELLRSDRPAKHVEHHLAQRIN